MQTTLPELKDSKPFKFVLTQSKQFKTLSGTFPLHLCDLHISGHASLYANDFCTLNITRIEYSGVNILDVLDAMGGLDKVQAAAENHVQNIVFPDTAISFDPVFSTSFIPA